MANDRKDPHADDELRKANERFQLVSLATNDAVWDWDLVGNTLWWNDGFFRLFGYPAVEKGIESWTSRLHPEDSARVIASIHDAIDHGRTSWVDEYRFRRADGSWADILDRGFVMRTDGKPVRMIGAMMDVSEQKAAQRAQAALTRVAEAAADARGLGELLGAIHAIVGTLLPARNFFIALLRPGGESLEFAYFRDEHDSPPTGPEPLGAGCTAYVLRTGKSLLLPTAEDFRALARTGAVELLGPPSASWIGVPLRSNRATIGVLVTQSYDDGVRYTVRDQQILEFVSTQIARAIERKQAEAKLLAADRMVSVGTLAAGVAHEINNPLSYVIANLELLDDALRTPPFDLREVLESVSDARDGALRVRKIVADLKTFSRSSDEPGGTVDVHRVLRSSIDLAWNEIRHRARLVEEFGADVPIAQGNEGRLGQVFLNLLLNAAQAIPEGHADSNTIRVCTRRETDGVLIEVHDSGGGIEPEHLPQLFDPFFTTKPVGVGTGLGLYISRNIIDGLGGSIQAQSSRDAGTTFRVWLPAARSAQQDTPRNPTPPSGRKDARVLVIDDEPQIGAVVARALSPLKVTVCTSATQALQSIRAGERYDAILCDLMMPEFTGMDFHAALQAEATPLAERVIFLTGGAFTERARAFLDGVPNERLQKPFELRALRAAVQALL